MNPIFNGMMQGVMQKAQQLAGAFQNPQQLVQRFFPDAPAQVANNPEQLLNWMKQTGKVNDQQIQMVRSMIGK